jgi:NAD(P)-dependent dehydrogenase (short-subunit alcohol dehydrogenase family)
MLTHPEVIRQSYKGSNKLEGKVALITGGDSGIGRSVSVHFAREGADIAIGFLPQEIDDANETKQLIEKEGRKCFLVSGDLRDKSYCTDIVEKTVKEFGKLNILVNNAGLQHLHDSLEEISDEEVQDTFDVNIISMIRVTRAALKYLNKGDNIICTSSVNAFIGNKVVSDYSATKGAVTAFSRALALQLADKGIRVNSVAPGPIWSPLIVSTCDKERIKNFGEECNLKRAGQPSEVAPSFVFLACDDASFFTGQTLHPNGGIIVNA